MLSEDAYADGGDRFWLADDLMAIGLGYRTNRAGAAAVAALAAPEGVAVEAYDLPHDQGPAHVLHLQSLISAVTDELCVVYEPLAPVRLLEDLRERGRRWIAIDRESYDAMGCNILAVRPGVVVMVDGVPAVRRALEQRGRRGARLRRLRAVAQGRRRADLPDRAAAAARVSRARGWAEDPCGRRQQLREGTECKVGGKRRSRAAHHGHAGAGGGAGVDRRGAPAEGPRRGRPRTRPRKNVIVLQGDGMATAQRDLIRLVTQGNTPDKELVMNRLEHSGLVHTDPADPEEAVTDSAAAATAFSTGFKSFNGAIGVDAQGRARPTLLEDARKMGKATGLVTTSQVTDATPAAYAAHIDDRAKQSEIAEQYLESSKPDVILGGGEDYWFPAGTEGGHPDHPATDPTEESKGTAGQPRRARPAARLPLREGPRGPARRRAAARCSACSPTRRCSSTGPRARATSTTRSCRCPRWRTKALDLLSSDRDGLFVLIEEEAIDEMAHENNAGLMIKSGEQLDKTVGVAVEFARRHPGTLIVVQGDHETGGLTIENPDDEDESGEELSKEDGPFTVKGTNLQVFADWTTGGHTGADTPITASGPGSERFDGVIDNTDVHHAIERAMRRR